MSKASFGPYFESQGGGILAMKWDENDISVCKRLLTFFLLHVVLTKFFCRVILSRSDTP